MKALIAVMLMLVFATGSIVADENCGPGYKAVHETLHGKGETEGEARKDVENQRPNGWHMEVNNIKRDGKYYYATEKGYTCERTEK